jgi:chromosome segregation ATPase
MACRFGACSLIKKAVVGTALSAGALYLVFGTSAPSYLKTAFHKVRDNAKGAVPVQFEIDRAREEVAALEPAIHDEIAKYSQAKVELETLQKEIAAMKANLKGEETAMQTMRDSLKSGDYRLVGTVNYSADEVNAALARRVDSYKLNTKLVENKEATFKAKRMTLDAAKQQFEQMVSAKKALIAKIDGIEARLRMIETTQSNRDFHFDDSALARAKESVSDLEKRLDVMAVQAEMEGKISTGSSLTVEPGRDAAKEVDALLGAPVKKAGDKSM